MKTFILKVMLFGVVLFGVDCLCGFTFSYMSNHAKGGYVAHYHYLIDKTTEDILIFGSSRAIHHYNPGIIEDTTRLTCFNCGQEGSGIIQNYGFWTLIKEHYHPKVVIYDVTDGFDLLEKEDNHYFLNWLKESYNRDGIPEIFYSVDKTERYKMLCQMYRYNSKFHQIIGDYIYPIYKVKEKGFIPLQGVIDPMRISNGSRAKDVFHFDSLKINYLKSLTKEMSGTELVFVVSPSWYGVNDEHFKPIEDICKEYDIRFLNFGNDERFAHNNAFFVDGLHMNSLGADEFTRLFMQELNISKLIKNEKRD